MSGTPAPAPTATAGTIATPASANKPADPKMGQWREAGMTGSNMWNCLVGGMPLADWSQLSPVQPNKIEFTTRFRPLNPILDVKGLTNRTKGLSAKFKKTDDLVVFQSKIWKHLVEHGLDTIAYLVDPSDITEVLDVVNNHTRYVVDMEKTELLFDQFESEFDDVDRTNDTAATTFFLDSLDPSIADDLVEDSELTDTFARVWLKFIRSLCTNSLNRFDSIKSQIRAKIPSQYAGQNIETMARELKKLAKILKSAGHFDHNLTLAVVKNFLRCECPDVYKTKLLQVQIKVQDAIKQCAYMTDDVQRFKHMKKKKVDFVSVCEIATEEYGLAVGDGDWGPSKLPKDTSKPPSAYVSMFGNFEKKVMALIQNTTSQPSDDNRLQNMTCFKCQKKGHMARNYPNNQQSRQSNSEGGKRGDQKRRGMVTNIGPTTIKYSASKR